MVKPIARTAATPQFLPQYVKGLDDEFQLIDSRRQISAWKPKTAMGMGRNGGRWVLKNIDNINWLVVTGMNYPI